jgi:Uma2 family endonuclease
MATIPSTSDLAPASPSPDVSSVPPVPSVAELYRLTAQNERVVIRGVDWAYYQKLLLTVGEHRGLRLAYDGKDLEIMSPSPLHEAAKVFAGRLVDLVTEELDIDVMNLASTTWSRPEIERAIEADECFYFRAEKLAQASEALLQKSGDIAGYPTPDLAIEIDLSQSKIDRPGIYAAMRVTEVWRFDTSGLVIERLNEGGSYTVAQESVFLPLSSEEVARWVLLESTSDRATWKRRLRAWIRSELLARPRPIQD